MPANPPDPSRRNERSRRAILDATLSLIAELGYDNVSIEAIARQAGVGKQTIYRWWPSKGAVALEAATHRLDPVVVYPDSGDNVADLRAQLTGIVELIATTGFGPAYRGQMAAGQSDPHLVGAVFDKVIEPNIAAFRDRIALDEPVQQLAQGLHVHVGAQLAAILGQGVPAAPRDADRAQAHRRRVGDHVRGVCAEGLFRAAKRDESS